MQIYMPQRAVGNSNVGGHTKRRRGTRRAKKKTRGTNIQVASLATGAFFFIFPYLLLNNLYIRVHKVQKYMFVCVYVNTRREVFYSSTLQQMRLSEGAYLPIYLRNWCSKMSRTIWTSIQFATGNIIGCNNGFNENREKRQKDRVVT